MPSFGGDETCAIVLYRRSPVHYGSHRHPHMRNAIRQKNPRPQPNLPACPTTAKTINSTLLNWLSLFFSYNVCVGTHVIAWLLCVQRVGIRRAPVSRTISKSSSNENIIWPHKLGAAHTPSIIIFATPVGKHRTRYGEGAFFGFFQDLLLKMSDSFFTQKALCTHNSWLCCACVYGVLSLVYIYL